MSARGPAALPLEVWVEFASTYSYPTAMRVEADAAARGVRMRWRVFLLGPIFAAQGWNTSPFALYPAKGRYMWRDLERICAAEGLGFRRPDPFPARSLLAARVALLAEGAPWEGAYVRAVFHAEFAEGRDIADPDTIRAALAAAGGDPALVEAAGDGAVKARLRARTAEAEARGIFGAPSFTVGDELFWGHDRLETALRWAAGGA